MYGPGAYGAAGYGAVGYGTGSCGAGSAIKWFYALLLLIVIVLQFGKKDLPVTTRKGCGDDGTCDGAPVAFDGSLFNRDRIDSSVLFIIIVFLLILCGGCFGFGGHGTAYGGGFAY